MASEQWGKGKAEQEKQRDRRPPARAIATTYKDLDNDPWLHEPWLPNKATSRAKCFREVSPNNRSNGSGIYFDNQEIPLPRNLPRKRQRIAPHVIQGMAMLPPPALCNPFELQKTRSASPVVAPAASASRNGHGVNYGWISYVSEDTNDNKEFREAAFALTTLCGRKVSSSDLLQSGDTAADSERRAGLKRERRASEERVN